MTWIDSAWRAAIAGAVTSAPIGWLAHRQRWGPFRYESTAQAAGFAAGLGALSAVASYWGLQRYLRDNLPASPGASAFRLLPTDPQPPFTRNPNNFACSGAWLNYVGVDYDSDATWLIMSYRGDRSPASAIPVIEHGFRSWWRGVFPDGIWANGLDCNGHQGSYLVTE